MNKQINAYINTILPELISLRREIHRNPELSNKEIQTSKLIQQKLIENGINATTIKSNTGVTAFIQGGQEGDTIAYRADLDALPMEEKTGLTFSSQNESVMHACGHDIHTTVLYGTALFNSILNYPLTKSHLFCFRRCRRLNCFHKERSLRFL
ncbi:M20/M25/M40 family metallo-hydrolase [Schnuerera ultunensis]|uniref:Uncharacterized protein n=1 Tax=[Clostridium] ultunense Esp TaxID=1288971 RepID=A0A1M4PN17_9FIRM|nr:M20/M25/M40 family metallo-hydrolase [Schnuerera ultunensis]SHD76860.1 protein of unknown function [[Clostridium] ultunense Esp]